MIWIWISSCDFNYWLDFDAAMEKPADFGIFIIFECNCNANNIIVIIITEVMRVM